MKVDRLNLGDLCRVPDSGLGEPRGKLIAAQKSAEGTVGEVNRWSGASWLRFPTYSALKARTVLPASAGSKWSGK